MRPEIPFQKQCALYLEWALPKPPAGPFWTAVNPIPGSSPALGKLAKDMGLRAGVTDFILVFLGKVFGIELKVGKGRPSKNQIKCHEDMRLAGVVIYVVYTFEDFVGAVKEIMGQVNARVA